MQLASFISYIFFYLCVDTYDSPVSSQTPRNLLVFTQYKTFRQYLCALSASSSSLTHPIFHFFLSLTLTILRFLSDLAWLAILPTHTVIRHSTIRIVRRTSDSVQNKCWHFITLVSVTKWYLLNSNRTKLSACVVFWVLTYCKMLM